MNWYVNNLYLKFVSYYINRGDSMKSRVDRNKKPSILFKAVVIFMVATVIYLWGYGHGQEATYDKINDEIKITQNKK
ncbi:hypothetical protein PQE73_gp161 [Bacillus phage vB_BanS_MrDarsey]|uniref:Uncharacterized protein n=1 Tax=Bacillus phage vB_BanS_MrDarsey TaxID=2894787 RepID=A0AAE8YPQ1_9CAUD|nr:hypothetical protein PQE73_gp161 [Bacillus phage vB_BanS_MrDarsey]UGO47993.1 hypothetical protein MRDARSEY_161 [Bacillus phage vB_BanS_MrDarsey]